LDDPGLADQIGGLFRALHPIAAAAWGDPGVELELTAPNEPDEDERPSIEDVARRCYLSPEVAEEWVTALKGTMRQGLFYGPPGTGKTFVAIELAKHLATSESHIEVVQFHSSYSYEDFIEGLRPEVDEASGQLRYVIRPGLFQEFCRRARAAADEAFVLVVDEMNRADLAAVFGELLLLLEYRGDRTVRLPYSQKRFSVPRNVILLGTMNTADRSLALVDFALRRRFNAFPLNPSRDVLAGWADEHPKAEGALLLAMFGLVQERVGAENPVSPGHSYWMVADADAKVAERVWSYQVKPYLAEHWFERPEELDRLDQDMRALIAEQS
jgi:MoxR-like ATPase